MSKERLHGIAGMTDSLRPVVAGKAKIGEKAANGAPSAIDYIRFVDARGNRIDEIHAELGEKPTEFIALFPSNSPDDFWWASYRKWGGGKGKTAGKLMCHGNGREAITDKDESITCPCEDAADGGPCKPTGSLKIIIPNVATIGVIQLDSRGITSINNIQYAISTIGNLTNGWYMGIPVKVSMFPFRGKFGINYAWQLDIMGTQGEVVSGAKKHLENKKAGILELIPPELLQIDESRPEPEALPSGGDDAPEATAETVELKDLGKLIRERSKVISWTAAKRKAEYDRLITEHDGDKEAAAEALLEVIEDEITLAEEAAEVFDDGS